MIYDEIKNIGKYKGISKWFDLAADFLLSADLTVLPDGRSAICGEDVFINVMEADTVSSNSIDFEIHKKYWDIQIDIEGTEQIQIGCGDRTVTAEYKGQTDFGTYSCKEHIDFVMGWGRFIVCMDDEPHKPTLKCLDSSRVRKCVVKVRAK